MALIRISHPDHRDFLLQQATEIGFSPYDRLDGGAKKPKGVINCRE